MKSELRLCNVMCQYDLWDRALSYAKWIISDYICNNVMCLYSAVSKFRYSDAEKAIFDHYFRVCILQKTAPPSCLLEKAASELPLRNILTIRTRVDNIIKGKMKYDIKYRHHLLASSSPPSNHVKPQ